MFKQKSLSEKNAKRKVFRGVVHILRFKNLIITVK